MTHELTVSTKAVTIVQESALPWCFNVIAEETCQVSPNSDPSDFNSLSLDFDMMGLGSKPVGEYYIGTKSMNSSLVNIKIMRLLNVEYYIDSLIDPQIGLF